MNPISIGIITIGIGLISWLVLGKVKQMWHQVHMFKHLGGPDAGNYVPSKEEVRELVGNIMNKAKDKKKKGIEQEQNNIDKGMYG